MSGVSRGESNPARAGAVPAEENIDLQSGTDPEGSQPPTVSTTIDQQSGADPSGSQSLIESNENLKSRTDPQGSLVQTENILKPSLNSSEALTRAEFEDRLAGQDEKLTLTIQSSERY